MNRVFSFIVAAAASSVLVHAQDPAPGDARVGRAADAQPANVTLVGCVRPGTAAVGTSGAATTAAAGQFVLSDVGAPSPEASRSGAEEASSVNERDKRTGGAAAAIGTLPRQVVLEGAAVAPHLNQRVEVTGTYVKEEGTDTTAGAAAPSSGAAPGDARTGRDGADGARDAAAPGASSAPAQRLQVTAVRRIVGTCGPQ